MKKNVILVFVLAAVLLFCGCGKTTKSSPEKLTTEDKIKLAEQSIGAQYSELETEIGPALESRHAVRCGTDGEDWEYTYDGFCVITYKEGNSEVVEEVEKSE